MASVAFGYGQLAPRTVVATALCCRGTRGTPTERRRYNVATSACGATDSPPPLDCRFRGFRVGEGEIDLAFEDIHARYDHAQFIADGETLPRLAPDQLSFTRVEDIKVVRE